MFARLGGAGGGPPWRVIAAWIVAAIVIVPPAPALPTSSQESDFLPSHYESIKALDLQSQAFPQAFTPSVIVVISRADGKALTAADSGKVGELAEGIEARRIPNVERVVGGQPSPNKLVQTVALQMPDLTQSNQDSLLDSVETLRADIKPLVQGSGLQAQTAGQVSQSYDQREASGNANAIVAFGTILHLSSGSTPATAESQVALTQLKRGLPPGATEPTDVFLRSDSGAKLSKPELDAFAAKLEAVDGVGSV